VLSLPVYPELSDEQLASIVAAVREIVAHQPAVPAGRS
jgi:dTDP-4-amino-4,6-dideoxygalactose transaminase